MYPKHLHLPVDFTLVDGLVATFALHLFGFVLLLFFPLFHVLLILRFLFLCLLCCHLFLHLLLIVGGVHLVALPVHVGQLVERRDDSERARAQVPHQPGSPAGTAAM